MEVLICSFREKSNQHENHYFKVTDFPNELKNPEISECYFLNDIFIPNSILGDKEEIAFKSGNSGCHESCN